MQVCSATCSRERLRLLRAALISWPSVWPTSRPDHASSLRDTCSTAASGACALTDRSSSRTRSASRRHTKLFGSMRSFERVFENPANGRVTTDIMTTSSTAQLQRREPAVVGPNSLICASESKVANQENSQKFSTGYSPLSELLCAYKVVKRRV